MNIHTYPPHIYNNLINETKIFEIKPTFVITTKSQHLRLPDGKLKFISSETLVSAHEEYASAAEAVVQKMLQIPQRMKHCVYNKCAMLNILVPTQEGGNKEEKNKALQEVNGFMSQACASLSKEKISITSEQAALFEDLSNAVIYAGLNSDTYELVRTPIDSTLDIPTHIDSHFLIAGSKPLNVSQVVENIINFFSDRDFRKIIKNPNNRFLLKSIHNTLIENQSRVNISPDFQKQIQNRIKYLNYVEKAQNIPSSKSF